MRWPMAGQNAVSNRDNLLAESRFADETQDRADLI
jgi:hypothetical protein